MRWSHQLPHQQRRAGAAVIDAMQGDVLAAVGGVIDLTPPWFDPFSGGKLTVENGVIAEDGVGVFFGVFSSRAQAIYLQGEIVDTAGLASDGEVADSAGGSDGDIELLGSFVDGEVAADSEGVSVEVYITTLPEEILCGAGEG